MRTAHPRAPAGVPGAVPTHGRAGAPAPYRKYRNRPTEVDGIRFASKKEAKRYTQLRLLQMAGEIRDLQCQPRYPLEVDGKLVCTYVADFAYRVPIKGTTGGVGGLEMCERVAEDVKGVKTAVFKLKAKLFAACYPHIELRLS